MDRDMEEAYGCFPGVCRALKMELQSRSWRKGKRRTAPGRRENVSCRFVDTLRAQVPETAGISTFGDKRGVNIMTYPAAMPASESVPALRSGS
jgi:hypothetical protein